MMNLGLGRKPRLSVETGSRWGRGVSRTKFENDSEWMRVRVYHDGTVVVSVKSVARF